VYWTLIGPEARDFFASSGLDMGILRTIWLLADIDGDNRLDRDEFAIAAHLTRKVRTGAALPSTLPSILRPNNTIATAVAAASSSVSSPLSLNVNTPLSQNTISATPPTPMAMPNDNSYSLSVPTSADDPSWAITPIERASYAIQFAKADADNNGFIRGREGAVFFSQSGLDSGILRKIWGLADVSEDGMLDREEFDIAVHLILKVRAGATIPDTLPPVLRPHVEGQRSLPTAAVVADPLAVPAPTSAGVPINGENKVEPSEIDMLAGFAPSSSPSTSTLPAISSPVPTSGIATPRTATFGPASSPSSFAASNNNDDGWAMSEADHASYVKLFQAQDTDGDGYIGGREALEFFLKSGLDTPTLRSVW
jgi:hypothetical protein